MRSKVFVVIALALVFSPVVTSIAEACGGFFSRGTVIGRTPEQRPSLAREKVLLIHDGEREHFIREVAFERANERFGFVVPTPTRPEVEAVAKTPFTKLRDRFPHAPPPRSGGYGRGSGSGSGGGGLGGGSTVEVLEIKKVGSFTAFVLAASDAQGLATWLEEHELVSTPEADVWLAHYVRMGFYYVAMRYDPPSGKGSGVVDAETIRISFATPVAYYPYYEPETESARTRRLLELWVVGPETLAPVALRESAGEGRWLSPFGEGLRVSDARRRLEGALAQELESLLPEQGELVVQTFQDQKVSRTGWGDVLFAHENAWTPTADQLAALEPLLGVLDPQLQAQEVSP